jgi:hypothetical protein
MFWGNHALATLTMTTVTSVKLVAAHFGIILEHASLLVCRVVESPLVYRLVHDSSTPYLFPCTSQLEIT